MTCRAPEPPLDSLFDTWKGGDVIHVIHDAAFPPASFNPGADAAGNLRKPTRFAPTRDVKMRMGGPMALNDVLRKAILEAALRAGIEAG